MVVPVVGGPSGSGLAKPEGLHKLAARLGIADVVRFRPPVDQDQLADWFRAASVLVMPSYSESFGLVAIEAQAAARRWSRPRSAVCRSPCATGSPASWSTGHDPRRLRRAPCAASSTPRSWSTGWATAAARHAQSLRLGHRGRGDGGRVRGGDARAPPSPTLGTMADAS